MIVVITLFLSALLAGAILGKWVTWLTITIAVFTYLAWGLLISKIVGGAAKLPR